MLKPGTLKPENLAVSRLACFIISGQSPEADAEPTSASASGRMYTRRQARSAGFSQVEM